MGYEYSAKQFIALCQSLRFGDVCSNYLEYLPTIPGPILDAGSGAGSWALTDNRLQTQMTGTIYPY